MTPPQQTALDFCRECLEWEDDVRLTDSMVRSGHGRDLCSLLFANLDAVLKAVRGWCNSEQAELAIFCYGGECRVNVILPAPGSIARTDYQPDLAHALLSACVAANRKLKGIIHD